MIIQGVETDGLLSWAKKTLARLDDERGGKLDDWAECGLAWLGKFGRGWKGVKPYRSQRYFPYPYALTNAVVASNVNGVMPHDDYFMVYGRTPVWDDNAKIAAEVLKYGHYKSNHRDEIRSIMLYAAIYGNAPYKVDWYQEVLHVPDTKAMAHKRGELYEGVVNSAMEQGQEPPAAHQVPILVETIQQSQVTWEAAKLSLVSIFNYWQDRWHRGETYPMRIIRDIKSKQHLIDLSMPDNNGYSIYEGVEDLNESKIESMADDQTMQLLHSRNNFNDNPSEGVELHEYWGDFKLTDPETGDPIVYKNHVLVVANQQKIIRFEPNPYKHGKSPWQLWVWQPVPGETYGFGVIEPILALNDALQVRWNQEIEAKGLEVQGIFEAKVGSLLDIDAIRVYPGAVYPTLDGNSIRKIDMGNGSSQAMEEIGFILNQMNEITGAIRAYSTENYQKSATEVSAIAGMNNAVNAERARYIEDTLLIRSMRMELQLYQQFMDQQIQIRIVNPQGGATRDPESGMPIATPPYITVNPNDISGEYDFVLQGASWLANRQNMAQAMQSVTLPIIQSPIMSQWLKPPDFITAVYQGFGIRDAWRWVKTQEEMYAEQQQQAAVGPNQQPGDPNAQGAGGGQGAQGNAGGGGAPSMAGQPSGPAGPPPSVDPGQLAGPQQPT
jgi:hypothetical protein